METIKSSDNEALVDCDWLSNQFHNPQLHILDASYFLPRQQRRAREEFDAQHIPGALFFDIDQVADLSSSLPHTLPNAEVFADHTGRLGIGPTDVVVVYDNNHFFASARAWWMFRLFGHDRVKVLNGGLSQWKAQGYPVTDAMSPPIAKTFIAKWRPELAIKLREMRRIEATKSRQIIDARSEDSFLGIRRTEYGDPRTGHIPGSINVPYRNLFAAEDHRLKSSEDLRKIFSMAAVDLAKPVVATCGSGVSAAMILLALFQIGIRDVPLYDGSWAEWSRYPDLPREVGP